MPRMDLTRLNDREIEHLLKHGSLNELRIFIVENAGSDDFYRLVGDVLEEAFERAFENGKLAAQQEFLERSVVEPAASWGH